MMEERAEIAPVDISGDNDAALMQKIACGDGRAFERLVQRHLPRSVRMAARITGSAAEAEDAVQEAFIRVWKHAAEWESPDATGAQFSTWFYRIVLNLCIDYKRKRTFTPIEDIPEPDDGRDNAETNLQRYELSQQVRDAVNGLPDRQRAAFVLCFYEECSNKEAASILGVSIKALESLLVRARKTLHDKLLPEKQ
jgi:RNA polymerase sigma-70 factor (ECF subfamily)